MWIGSHHQRALLESSARASVTRRNSRLPRDAPIQISYLGGAAGYRPRGTATSPSILPIRFVTVICRRYASWSQSSQYAQSECHLAFATHRVCIHVVRQRKAALELPRNLDSMESRLVFGRLLGSPLMDTTP